MLRSSSETQSEFEQKLPFATMPRRETQTHIISKYGHKEKLTDFPFFLLFGTFMAAATRRIFKQSTQAAKQ